MSTTLTTPETRKFAKLESIIESGLSSFIATGNALAKIRDAELYRGTHKTFDAYCRDRWKIAKSRAYQLIAAAETIEAISTVVDVVPANERQARPLVDLPKEDRPAAWQEAVETAPEGGVTAEHVAEVVAKRNTPVDHVATLGKLREIAGDAYDSDEPAEVEPVEPKPPKIVPDNTRDRFLQLWNSTGRTGRILIRALAAD
jgi:hypothetical protein